MVVPGIAAVDPGELDRRRRGVVGEVRTIFGGEKVGGIRRQQIAGRLAALHGGAVAVADQTEGDAPKALFHQGVYLRQADGADAVRAGEQQQKALRSDADGPGKGAHVLIYGLFVQIETLAAIAGDDSAVAHLPAGERHVKHDGLELDLGVYVTPVEPDQVVRRAPYPSVAGLLGVEGLKPEPVVARIGARRAQDLLQRRAGALDGPWLSLPGHLPAPLPLLAVFFDVFQGHDKALPPSGMVRWDSTDSILSYIR